MFRRLSRRKLLIWYGLSLFLVILVPFPPRQDTPGEHFIRIEASTFAYSPSVVRVNPGDLVTIELLSTDVVHGLYLDDYALQIVSDPGQKATISFVADRSGVFRFRCVVPCGTLHPFMIGKLRVGQNTLFYRSIGVSIIIVLFLSLWTFQRLNTSI